MLFHDKRKLLELYNALNGSCYKRPQDLKIVTLENAIYMGMRNDLSFYFTAGSAFLSSRIPGIQICRCAVFSISVTANSMLTEQENLYSTGLVKIPAPFQRL